MLFLLAGCGAQPEPTVVTESAVTVVSNVDELLSAIAPGAEIVLEPGEYCLGQAANYGDDSENPYYVWENAHDGYELKLVGINDLVLRGSGVGETILSAIPRYANVLTLQNCSNIILEDFTAGHTAAPGECSGGVMQIKGCLNVDMNRLGLYGCGINGVKAYVSTGVRITDCDIYDCSSSGVIAEECDSFTVRRCRLYDLGDPTYGGYAVFDLSGNTRVDILDCEIRDNVVYTLVNSHPSDGLTIQGCDFSGNRVRSACFDTYGAEPMVLDECDFRDNVIRNWYTPYGRQAADKSGNDLSEEALNALHSVQSPQEQVERTVVHVKTVDEFLAAIAPNTEIVLDEEMYDFSTADGYGVNDNRNPYYYWEDIFDGPGLVITDVENFAITGATGARKKHTINAVPRYAQVLTFSRCSDIRLSGFTAGHTPEPGSCTGGVIMLRDSDRVTVESCGLFGCGTWGVQAEYCADITVRDCDIYECSSGGIQMTGVNNIIIEQCSFRDLGGSRIWIHESRNVQIDGRIYDGTTEIP